MDWGGGGDSFLYDGGDTEVLSAHHSLKVSTHRPINARNEKEKHTAYLIFLFHSFWMLYTVGERVQRGNLAFNSC
jgi:hypothetical protein